MAEVSEALTDIRTELRQTRSAIRPAANAYSTEQMSAIRKVLFAMALDGRFGPDDLAELSSVQLTRSYSAFLERLREEMAKPLPSDDPWGSAPASGSFGASDDEPPF